MEKNKTGKPALPAGRYLKYAIGEIVLVVIGILIALSINNWNESRKLEQKKQELVLGLIDDFEENIVKLKSSIEHSNLSENQMNEFLKNAYATNPKISVDSLKTLSNGFFRVTRFFPSLTTYEEAKANGSLSLLQSKDLSKSFTEFLTSYSTNLTVQDQSANSYFNGSLWELKKTLGSLGVITGFNKNRFNLKTQNIDSFRDLINTPLVTANFENRNILNANINRTLKQMDTISRDIVKKLNKLKK